ncbi:MAG: MFS transporter [Rhodobacteraceae bacterium]|nr:MFS transporter [Paracoccaceae bacterium]
MIAFLTQNLRWLAPGFLLTFASAFGQTWFIALFAGEIKAVYGLSDGGWGSLYTLATLVAAGLLFLRGALADTMPLGRLAAGVALAFALAAALMAWTSSPWLLGLALIGLRFCGQGMFPHVALTAMGRWFRAQRGRAVSLVILGHAFGEMVIPLITVAAIAALGWRLTWGGVALMLALGLAPAAALLFARGRAPEGGGEGGGEEAPGLGGRHWSRADALGHWLLPALLPFLLTPGFVGTVVYFHQSNISAVKGWAQAEMARGYPVYAALAIAAALFAGWACDRFGPERLLPVFLLPMALGVTLIGPAGQVGLWIAALGLLGATQGTASALWGALLPAVYGTRHLGAVRSLATTVMVVSTAIGPGITGILIDRGIDFPRQCLAMGIWCLGLGALGLVVLRRLRLEAAPRPGPAGPVGDPST